jgi:hypothetical protein
MQGRGAGAPGSEREVAPRLLEEFGSVLDARTIRRVAREELALFGNATDRSRVADTAWRLARGRLLEMTPADARRRLAS